MFPVIPYAVDLILEHISRKENTDLIIKEFETDIMSKRVTSDLAYTNERGEKNLPLFLFIKD